MRSVRRGFARAVHSIYAVNRACNGVVRVRRVPLWLPVAVLLWSAGASAESHRHLHRAPGHDATVSHTAAKNVRHADAVKVCVASLAQAIRHNRRYDRLLQLDVDVLRAKVDARPDGLFSIAQPVPVEATVTLRGSARTRGEWKWQPVVTRCGLRSGKVVTTSIEPRIAPARPTAKQPRRPVIDYSNYVDNGTWTPSGGAMASA